MQNTCNGNTLTSNDNLHVLYIHPPVYHRKLFIEMMVYGGEPFLIVFTINLCIHQGIDFAQGMFLSSRRKVNSLKKNGCNFFLSLHCKQTSVTWKLTYMYLGTNTRSFELPMNRQAR